MPRLHVDMLPFELSRTLKWSRVQLPFGEANLELLKWWNLTIFRDGFLSKNGWGFPPSQPCIMLDDPWGDERWETGRRAQFRRSWRNTGDFLRTRQLDLMLNSGWKNANNYGDRFQKCLENSRTCSSIFRVAKVLCEKCREWWVVAREDLFLTDLSQR